MACAILGVNPPFTLAQSMNVAYLLHQPLDLRLSTGTPLHIQGALQAIHHAADRVALVGIKGRDLYMMEIPERLSLARDFKPTELSELPSWRRILAPVERPVRRMQSALDAPYYCFFDTLRLTSAPRERMDDFDVLHAHFDIVPLGSALLSRRLRKPLVIDAEADWFDEIAADGLEIAPSFERWARFAQHQCLRQAAAITVVSDELKQRFVEHWGLPAQRIHVLPNGVDVDKLARAHEATDCDNWRKTLNISDQERVVMFVGGFYRRHGLDQLIHSFRLVHDKISDSVLVMVGDGNLQPQIVDLVQELGLASAVRLTGAVPHDDIPCILQIADVTVSPANERYVTGEVKPLQTSPLKLLEYMAAETACVASGTGQQKQVIEHMETGLLVPPGDLPGFAEAIIYLLNNPAEARRIAANARLHVCENHSWARYGRQLQSIYSDIRPKKARLAG